MIDEYTEEGQEDGQYEKLKLLTKKAVGTVWVWTIKYIKKRTFAMLESQAYKFLDEHASEWAELPLLDSGDDDGNVIDAEIDE